MGGRIHVLNLINLTSRPKKKLFKISTKTLRVKITQAKHKKNTFKLMKSVCLCLNTIGVPPLTDHPVLLLKKDYNKSQRLTWKLKIILLFKPPFLGFNVSFREGKHF